MLLMHDRVTGFDLGEIAQHGFAHHGSLARITLAAAMQMPRIQLALGNEGHSVIRGYETAMQRRYAQHERFVALQELRVIVAISG